MMSKFKVNLFAAHPLGSMEYAEKFYAILDSWGYSPEVYDETEPIQQPWENKEGFVNLWKQEGRSSFGIILTKCRRRFSYDTMVKFQFGPDRINDGKPPYHGISIYAVKESQCQGENRERLIKLVDQLFVGLEIDYGFMCLEEEYDVKNIIKDVRHPDGSLEPRHVIGMKWPYHLPGLYWMNYFGRKYLEQGLGEHLDRCPSLMVKQFSSGGVRVQLSERPDYFREASATEIEKSALDSLGRDWFFENDRVKQCIPLDVSLEHFRNP